MNDWDNSQYQKTVSNIKICLDVALAKINRKEDPLVIERIIKGVDSMILKCYNMNPGKDKQNELVKMHEMNLTVFSLLDMVKTCGWEMLEFE